MGLGTVWDRPALGLCPRVGDEEEKTPLWSCFSAPGPLPPPSAAAMAAAITEDALVFEEELQRNPFCLKTWVSYVEAQKAAPGAARLVLYERAVAQLPGSYKLWHAYLVEAVKEVSTLSLCLSRFSLCCSLQGVQAHASLATNRP